MKRYLPFIIIAVVLLVTIGVVVSMLRPSASSSTQPATNNNASANVAAPVTNYAGAPSAEPPHVRGASSDAATSGAAVTLEEFGDFQCPPCGLLYPDLKKLESTYGTRLRVVFREFPLATMHKNAFDAARAAEAAELQGKFWEMHDKLYENQKMWSDATPNARPVFMDFARSLGLDVERFARDLDGQIANSRILLDMKRGDSLGVKGTPTLFIDKREVKADDMTPAALSAAIDAALSTGNQSHK